MCILCVIQKWSRRVATMLPWLVIPLIGLWFLSQFLPPAFRFEITSPRLACVFVLLITLFWYEILMPQLSAWRVRRNARLREKKRSEAIEMQKLRKTATRRCRNCLTPYRDQNPLGGRFMCSYCGHMSKRPVLELSVPRGLGKLSNSEMLKDLTRKSGKMLNGQVWSDNNWICGLDLSENGGNWVDRSLCGKFSYSKKNRGSNDDDYFFSGKSNFFFLVFICKSLSTIFLGIMWPWRKLFRVSLANGGTLADMQDLGKKGENCNESRTEKARRKAEEKRQARLEREQLEEEERKQREEVARLVEERRKMREVKAEPVKDQHRMSPRNHSLKREAEMKKQDRKKEKDWGSSKSNSDVEIDRNMKGGFKTESSKFIAPNNHKNGSDGPRYLDRMRRNFFPSSKTLGGGVFRKRTNENVQITVTRRDIVHPENAHRKSNAYNDDRKHNRPVFFESQPNPAPKRSWQQLFTQPSPTTSNVISRPNGNQTEPQTSISSVFPVVEGFDNPATSGFPCPLPRSPHENAIITNDAQLSSYSMLEELEHFGNPRYVPDATSVAGFEMNRVSPVESPMPQLRASGEMQADSFLFPSNQPTRDKLNLPIEDQSTENEKGWQMWNSSTLQDTLGLVGGLPAWYFPEKAAGTYNGFPPATRDDPWTSRISYGSISRNADQLPLTPNEGTARNEELFCGGVWGKKEKAACVSEKGVGFPTTSTMIPPGGGLPNQMYSPFGHMN